MHIDFYGETFDKYERLKSMPYLGFFSPKGKLVDYNTELGGSHGNLGNLVSWTFLLWIKQYNIIRDLNLKDIKTFSKLNPNNGIIVNADIACNEYNDKSNLLLLQNDLLKYLKKVNDSEQFRELINKRIDLEKFPDYILKDRKLPLCGESIYEIENLFGRDNTRRLLMFLKDIIIQHLGYDAIERIKPNNEELVLPDYYYLYPEDYLTYFDKPRTITTVYNNINERFYNYLLMDWKIQKVPRYVYNEETKQFNIDSVLYESDRDLSFEQELNTIKRNYPIKERVKFFK